MKRLPGPVNLYEQAARSLNFFQGCVDYWQNCLPFFWVKFNDQATGLQHNHWDHSENPGRLLYGATLSRVIKTLERHHPSRHLLFDYVAGPRNHTDYRPAIGLFRTWERRLHHLYVR